MKLWGIDLGGTKIECAVLGEDHELVVRRRTATESNKGYRYVLGKVQRLIEEVSVEIGEKPAHIGFATPGVLSPDTRKMKNCNIVCMNGEPMDEDLRTILGVPVKMANDANCFALSETLMGTGKEYRDAEVVFGVIMGTGVGGGLVVHGKIIKGIQNLGGEWGHNVLEEGGDICYCGKKGCVEQVISGPALEKFYLRNSGKALKLKEIMRNFSEETDKYAKATVERLIENYGRAIATLINVIDPHLIVIGGGVGNIDLLYSEGYERIKKYVFNDGKLKTRICKPLLGDSAGVYGAALLWDESNSVMAK